MSFLRGLFGSRRPTRPRPPTPTPSPAPSPSPPGDEPAPPITGAPRSILVSPGPFYRRQYSYWANAWRDGQTAYVFAGDPARGGPAFFSVDLPSTVASPWDGRVSYGGETEGWYWGREGEIYLLHGAQLRRVNPFTGEDHVIYDNNNFMGGTRLWQAHSSDDGQVHSATVEQITSAGAYPRLGTVVLYRGTRHFFSAEGRLDESQVDRSGEYLLIKENDDNRIITLATGEIRYLRDHEGALGHSDCGHDFAVGENNQIGACMYLDLHTLHQRQLFATWNMGYVSVRGGRCLHSGDTHLRLINLESGAATDVHDHGVRSGNYDERVKANLDPTGTVATYMAHGTLHLLVL